MKIKLILFLSLLMILLSSFANGQWERVGQSFIEDFSEDPGWRCSGTGNEWDSTNEHLDWYNNRDGQQRFCIGDLPFNISLGDSFHVSYTLYIQSSSPTYASYPIFGIMKNHTLPSAYPNANPVIANFLKTADKGNTPYVYYRHVDDLGTPVTIQYTSYPMSSERKAGFYSSGANNKNIVYYFGGATNTQDLSSKSFTNMDTFVNVWGYDGESSSAYFSGYIDNINITYFDLEAPSFELTLKNSYDSEMINNFTVQIIGQNNSANISTTNGTVLWNSEDVIDVFVFNIDDNKYFNTSTTGINTSSFFYTMGVWQSEVEFTASDGIEHNTIENFTVEIGGLVENSTNNVSSFKLNAGEYNYTAYADGYDSYYGTISLDLFEQKNVNVNLTQTDVFNYGPFNSSERFNRVILDSDCTDNSAIKISRYLDNFTELSGEMSHVFDDFDYGFYLNINTSKCTWVWVDLMDKLNATESEANMVFDNIIENSVIYDDATVYNDQQVYLRNVNGDAVLLNADRVIVYGNQRWIFNYNTMDKVGLFNISPLVYVLDLVNMSTYDMLSQYENFIDSTKE